MASLESRARELKESVAELEQLYKDPNSAVALSATLPSLLVAINGGVVKITEISADSVKGEVYLPLSPPMPPLPAPGRS